MEKEDSSRDGKFDIALARLSDDDNNPNSLLDLKDFEKDDPTRAGKRLLLDLESELDSLRKIITDGVPKGSDK